MADATESPTIPETKYEMGKHIIIDEKALEDLKPLKLDQYCIYKAPCNLRNINKEAYTPQLISIGPHHFGTEELKLMQEHKLRYFAFFRERVSDEQALRDYKAFLERQEDEIRHCYAKKFSDTIKKDEFVNIVGLDAVFIMELLLRKHEYDVEGKHKDDYIWAQLWLSKSITRDLILLENQLPFFVLSKLHDIVPNYRKKHCGFFDLAHEYFAFYYQNKKILDWKSMKNGSGTEPKHFTDLIRSFYLVENFADFRSYSSIPRTATKLQESGVSFEKVEDKHLLDITFEKKPFLSRFLCLGCLPYMTHFKARFQIPQLKVDHTTECVLRNLIAFEQCHYPEQPYICNYVSLIDSLIHTKDAVELLVEKEVIHHELGSHKEVATLVNGLCKHVVANSTCYHKIIKQLNEHYMNIWNRSMAALGLVYFRDPWRASSTVVGIAVLVFTVFNFCRVIRVVF